MRYQNNPGNIRTNPELEGFIGSQNGFSIFRNMGFGLKAIQTILNTYYTKYNLTTIKEIIFRYAPPNENNSIHYVDFVAKNSGFSPNEKLEKSDLIKLIPSIVKIETNSNFTVSEVQNLISKAGIINPFPFLFLAIAGIYFFFLFLAIAGIYFFSKN